ncbi:BamA/TamA family outer membrane protein [Flavobacterium litorale]|uniref:Outer membrane protein assembly factor n=1 Tax=Flavobacterium litorale TaxID=2856519 RepID=A0ABX8V4Y1_9FLAO|nr:BamA/TamA family outer membrane protein [Flavobacterium litorale]QYJ67893.1 outer membrane protein assembly factor [Flavobacterium litorale]
MLLHFFKKQSLFIFLLLSVICSHQLKAQDFKDVKEFFTFYPNRKAVQKDSTLYLAKFIAAPVVSYSPETNFGFGTGAKYLFKFKGSGPETRVSNMPLSLRYTLNNQFILYSGFEIFTNQEKWVIEGNLLFRNYPRLYYGIGRDSKKEDEEEYDYYQVLVEPIFLKQLFTRYLFIGAGFRYNQIFNTRIEEDGLLNITKPNGFDGSRAIGIEAATLYDSRNNVLNAQKGWYLEFTHGEYGEAIGSTHNFNLTKFDLRHYFSPIPNSKDVLAIQTLGHFSRGDVPFNELALFGSNQILRGYREGRFVDRDLLAAQAEYRKRFGESRFGAVAFVGAGDVYNSVDDFQFKNLRYNFGAGLRFMVDRLEKLNIRLDWGFGQSSNYIYLGIAEAF